MALKIGHLNVRSLLNGFDAFKEFIISENFDICAVSETWLSSNISSDVVGIENYTFIRKDRESRGGGVGFYIKDFLNVKIINTPADTSLEQLWFSASISGRMCVFGVLYRPPSAGIPNMIRSLDLSLSEIILMSDLLVLTGDLNIDFLSIGGSSITYVNNLLESYSLSQVVDQPTRVAGQSQTLIDVIITNNLPLLTSPQVMDSGVSTDHFAVTCMVSIAKDKPPAKFVTFRDFQNFESSCIGM